MNAVLSLAVILIVSCGTVVVFFIMAVSGDKEKEPEPGEVDTTDYTDAEEEYYR